MYKYKQTTDVEVNDLVVWTELPHSVTNRINNKVYKVIGRTMDNSPLVVDETGLEKMYGRAHGFKVLQTKPASEAVVGDYMYRITSGPDKFPQYSIIKITKIDDKSNISNLYYTSTSSVSFNEVIVIAQAEPEVKYPLFMYWYNNTGTLVKFDGLQSGAQLTDSEFNNAGDYSLGWSEHTDPRWKPCDFTIQPNIDDIDWWQGRFEAGLPVYATDSTSTFLCKGIEPKQWYNGVTFSMTDPSLIQKVPMSKEDIELFKQQVPLSTLHLGLCNEISLGATADCSLQSTIKEQPMKLQQLLDAIFGVSDYEAKPKFIVTVFNNDKEVGTTTAESIEEIQQTIQSDTRLWGCKLVAYKIHSELQTQVPVAITKFKKEPNASAE